MNTSLDSSRQAVRRAYELGRLRSAALRAVLVAAACTALGWTSLGLSAGAWAVMPWAAWTVLEWRGGALRSGGVRGMLAGAAMVVLPMTWLRPCCAPGMMLGDGACCTQPSVCLAAGSLVGLLAAASLPRAALVRWREAALGMGLGVASVAAARCAALLAGEAAGLLAGMMVVVALTSAVRARLVSVGADGAR